MIVLTAEEEEAVWHLGANEPFLSKDASGRIDDSLLGPLDSK